MFQLHKKRKKRNKLNEFPTNPILPYTCNLLQNYFVLQNKREEKFHNARSPCILTSPRINHSRGLRTAVFQESGKQKTTTRAINRGGAERSVYALPETIRRQTKINSRGARLRSRKQIIPHNNEIGGRDGKSHPISSKRRHDFTVFVSLSRVSTTLPSSISLLTRDAQAAPRLRRNSQSVRINPWNWVAKTVSLLRLEPPGCVATP